jgi:hypothetical protein
VYFVGDGVPAMIDKENGVAAKLRRKLKKCGIDLFFSSPLTLHQEGLRARILKTNRVMITVIRTVNFVGLNALYCRKFL